MWISFCSWLYVDNEKRVTYLANFTLPVRKGRNTSKKNWNCFRAGCGNYFLQWNFFELRAYKDLQFWFTFACPLARVMAIRWKFLSVWLSHGSLDKSVLSLWVDQGALVFLKKGEQHGVNFLDAFKGHFRRKEGETTYVRRLLAWHGQL